MSLHQNDSVITLHGEGGGGGGGGQGRRQRYGRYGHGRTGF